MFPDTPDGAVEEKAARSGLFVRISPGRPHGLWRDRYASGAISSAGGSAAASDSSTGASATASGASLDRLRGDRLLGRQLAALGHDERAHGRGHVGEELDGDFVAADLLDRLGQVDLAPVDADLRHLPELVGEIGRRDRAEQRPGRAGLDVEAELRLLERRRQLARLVERRGLLPRALRGALLDLGDPRRRGRLGEPARDQEVPRVPARDVDDLAAQADLLDVLAQDDLHQFPET